MPVYGTVRYHNRRYGAYGVTAARDLDRAVLGGQAPWNAPLTIPWRTASVAVHAVEISDYSLLGALPLLGLGGRREAQLENGRYQSERLTVTLNDQFGYLPGGSYAALVAPDAPLRAIWTVASPGGTVTWPSPVYRVLTPPSRDDDVRGGGALTVVAEDWISGQRRREASASGTYSWAQLQAWRDQALADGMPPIGAPDTIATVTASLLWNQGALGLVIDPGWAPTRLAPFSDAGLDLIPFLLTQPGTPATFGDLFDYLWDYEPFRITYDAQGRPAFRPGLVRRGSPWLVSRDPAVGGTLALPWETLGRAVRDAAFTAVEYQVVGNEPSTAAGVGGLGTDVDFGGHAVSTSLINPHRPGVTKTQRTTDRTPGRSTAGFASLNAYAAYLLAQELGAADTVTLTCDSAVRLHDLGDELRLCDLPQVDGVYRLTAVSQPFDEEPASLTLEWVTDG